jgi:hypothetical protein
MLTCSWKKHLGIECPGCGFQRSFIKLWQGEIVESFFLFPATIPLLLTFTLLLLHLKFKFKFGAYLLVGLFSLSTLLILVNFILKQF